MSLDRAHELLSTVGQLPVLPDQANHLLRFSTARDVTIEELLEVVERDPVLSAMVLRVVNSAAFGLGRPVTSLSQSLVLLGTSHVRSLALAASMSTTLSSGDGAMSETIWRDAFAVACGARVSAGRIYPLETGTAFACGLIHHIGEIVIRSHYAAESAEISALTQNGMAQLDAERQILGATHPEIGASLASHWQLPEILQVGVLWHHGTSSTDEFLTAPSAGTVGALVVACVQTSVTTWYALENGESPQQIQDIADLCATVGVSNWQPLVAEMRKEIDRHLGAAGLPVSGTAQDHEPAI